MYRLNSITLKDHLRDELIFNRRLIIASLLVFIFLLVLVARLTYLQIINQKHYATLSENNRVSIQPIQSIRGLIYDRNGVLLAQNLPGFSLELIPEHIQDINETLTKLGKLIAISKEDRERLFRNLKKKRRFEGIPLRYRLTEGEVARVSVKQHQLPGVEIRAELSRNYPLGKLTAHSIGYVSRINEQELQRADATNYSGISRIGKIGIERQYEKQLHGRVGLQQVETNASGRILRILDQELPVPGKNLYLNLDIRLHRAAQQAFKDHNGALVAIDPNNGAVLALVSYPSYDPNLFVNGIDTHQYQKIRSSPEQPLFNRAIQGRYPPGSTIKPFIGLAGLEYGVMKSDAKINCPGWYELENDDRKYRDWKKKGHKRTDLGKAIIESCDVYFYDLALALGIDRISSFLATFGFGKKTGIDLVGESAALLPSRQWKEKNKHLPWFPGETLITGIGQGFTLITPLQLASTTATLALYGKRQVPRMVYAVQDPETKTLELIPPKALPSIPIVQHHNWDYIIQSMKQVVHSIHGTARGINRNLDYKIAGKTGTSQVYGIKQDEEYDKTKLAKKFRDHALFIAFAPVEQPKIAVAVIVENGGHGGSVAAPIARKIMDTYLKQDKTHAP